MRKQKWITIPLGIALTCVPLQQAQAQFVVSDPPLQATTLLMRAQQVLQYVKEAQTALNAIQMAQIMAREGVNLAKHPSTNIAADLGQLSNILTASQGLAGDLAVMDATFRQTYGNYTGPDPTISYALKYSNWASTSLKTIHGAANAAGYQGNLLQNEQLWMAQVQTMNQTPAGRNEALQLGNTIAIEEVAQLQKLRQLMIADMSFKAAFTAQQVTTQQAQQSAQQNGFTHANWTADPRSW